MADTLWNDIMYTDVMQSPGYVVDYAICTTYSLDMPTLLSIPFMMGTMNELTESALKSPHIVLEAINRAAGKFSVFCNAGCIAVPQNASKVYSLLEKSVVQIALPAKDSGFINFHPKVWVIKETNPDDGQSQIKVVVMSRNLTGSSDLDIACELTGKIGKKPVAKEIQKKHKPLIEFIEWLRDQTHGSIKTNIQRIIDVIPYLERFNTDDSLFQDYDFFPMGIDGYNGRDDCFKDNMLEHAAEAVIISPFVDKSILNDIVKCCPSAKKTLITKYASITPDILSQFNDGVYAVKEVLTDKTEKETVVDIHEKVYFIRNYYTCQNTLYLGSTNATNTGFSRNVEFLLRLTFSPNIMSYQRYRQELINDSADCLFEQVKSVAENNVTKEDATDEHALRQAIAHIYGATVEKEENKFRIIIHCKKRQLNKPINIYPLYCSGMAQQLIDGATFADVPLPMLSEFFVLEVGDLKRVVKIECGNFPNEERDKAVFRSVIDTKSKFINYLAFMLTDDTEQFIIESSQLEKEYQINGSSTNDAEVSASLYEDMVRMAYKEPERIASIRKVIEKADESVLPERFKDMYQQFETVIRKIRKL